MYKKILTGLFLVLTTLQKKTVTLSKVLTKRNHIFIFDRSGSMSWTLRDLIEDLILQVAKIPDGDTFSAGWFSSKGEFGWICKGLSVSENREALPAMLRKYNNTVGLTCYSEILKDTNQVVADLAAISENNVVTFFSDGFPNQETHSIIDICKSLAPKLSSVMLVGYGDWYGRDLMAQMAQALGGILIHSSSIKEFSSAFASFRENSEDVQPRVEFEVPKGAVKFITTIDKNGEVVTHSVDEGKLFLSPDTEKILYFVEKEPSGMKEIDSKNLEPSIYAVARSASQLGDYRLALKLLGVIGDVKYIDALNNSFTIGEYGKVEKELAEAVTDENMRFVFGQKDNYVPADDQFCGLDFMDALLQDETAVFLPRHPAFDYKKVSRGTEQVNKDLKFVADANVEVKFQDLVWSSKNLNLSVRALTTGKVVLDDDAVKVGLDKNFSAKKWNNYTLIHDGKWQGVVENLPVKNLSPATLELIEKHNLLVRQDGDVLILNLKRIPVINRKIAESFTDFEVVCESIGSELGLEAKQLVYGSLYGRFPEEVKEQIENLVKPTTFNDQQLAYLEKFEIDRGGFFQPKSITLPVKDSIPVTEIKFAVKNFSSLPKVSDVETKIADKKKLTASDQLVASTLEACNKELSTLKTDKQKALWLKEERDQVRKDLFEIRKNLNRAKFAVVLGKTNFVQIPKLQDGDNPDKPYEYKGLGYQLKINTNAKVDI